MLIYENGDSKLRLESRVVFELKCENCGCRFGVQEHDEYHTIRPETCSQEGDGLYSIRCPNCLRDVVFE